MYESNKTLWHVYDLNRSADSIRAEPGTCHDVGLYLRAELSKLYRTAVEFITERASELVDARRLSRATTPRARRPPSSFSCIITVRQSSSWRSMSAPLLQVCACACSPPPAAPADVVPRDLSSRNLRSLCELLLHRDASGAFRRYQSQLEPTPLQRDAVANASSVARGLERQDEALARHRRRRGRAQAARGRWQAARRTAGAEAIGGGRRAPRRARACRQRGARRRGAPAAADDVGDSIAPTLRWRARTRVACPTDSSACACACAARTCCAACAR
jgi:hypothetical protein